ncbi:MAG: Two component regulator three Y domain-containing protein [Flavobacteriaceae bacterium]
MKKRLGLCLLICSISFLVSGQNLLPPVYNYKTIEYGAASKNWGISSNEDGELFVANNSGLLHFNGEEWTLNKLPNNTIIRSVYCHGNRIFTGSYEEFGYWIKNETGSLEYTSLTHLIREHVFTSEEFWEIISFDEKIIFRSFSSIYSFENDSIKVIDPVQIISHFIEFNGKIIVASSGKELFELQGDYLVPLSDQDRLKDKTITDMALIGDKLLIGTKLNGCFLYGEDGKLIPWEFELNNQLKKQQLNKIISVGDDKIAFGTIKNGIYIYDLKSKTYENINRQLGLQNNTVLSMLYYDNQLWLGLDNGIDYIKLNNPIRYYTDFTGVLGTVYDIETHKGKLYLGSNTGVYFFEDDKLEFVDGTQGHVWDLEVIDNDLLCGHNSTTYKINEGSLARISDVAGGYKIVKVPEKTLTYIQGNYNGLAKFDKQNFKDWKVERVEGFEFPTKQLCFENPNTIWAAHPYKGLYRIKVNKENNEAIDVKQFKDEGITDDYNVRLYNIKNQIVFNNRGAWYKYDPILDKIIAFKEFETFTNRELLYFDDDYFWFADTEGNKEITYTNLKSDSLVISYPQLQERLVPEAQKIIKRNDSVFLFTLSDGFGEINLSKLKRQLNNFVLPTPTLSSFKDEANYYTIGKEYKEIPFKSSQNIVVKITSPVLNQARYYYNLDGKLGKKGYLDSGELNFQNLPFGDYELNISSVSIDNKISEPHTILFKIAPPWYFSYLSLVGYLIIALGIIYWIRDYNKGKLRRKQLQLQKQMQREQHERMVEIEKDKLEKEIRIKQNELTSTTLNIAKKNEMILELKNMLVMNKEKFPSSQRYRSFMKKLDNSIHDTEDWKRFEVNFKELHNDFFERLLKKYPKLTPKDLKLCAYLKMNLSTKEIAPLMAITIRGVEIHRYRLRKKLEIDNSKNLSNFLITF